MKVLKFGGTSVGSSENIKKVTQIVKSKSENTSVTLVVSAVGGITDKLMNASNKAIQKDIEYKFDFDLIRNQHSEIMEKLLEGVSLTNTKELVFEKLNELEKLLEGIYLVNELSSQTTDKLLSFGELISSLIIFEYMQQQGLNVQLKNSQNLIVTDSNFTNAKVQFEETNENIINYFNTNNKMITILPGFISKSETGEITTLGRGGSDYTAATFQPDLMERALKI